MEISAAEYFFYEWLIIEKRITAEKFQLLTKVELKDLYNEYMGFVTNLRSPD